MNNENNDNWGIIWVSPNYSMKGKFNIYGVGESELDSSLISRAVTDDSLSATITIRSGGNYELNSSIDVKYKGESELNAFLTPLGSHFVDATFNVRPHGIAYGIFDIIEPPKINEILNPIKDATTMSSVGYKYINFGKTTTMMVGRDDTGTLRSFIDFDFHKYPQTLEVLKAKLKIYFSGTLQNLDTLELWSVDREWEETGITDSNRPFAKGLLSSTYTVNHAEQYVEFDILTNVKDIISKKMEYYGLTLISSNNLTDSFFTRESSKSPTLDMTYFDTQVWTLSKNELTSTIMVYGVGNDGLNAFFSVNTDRADDDLISTFYLHRADTPLEKDIQGRIHVSTPDLKSKLTIAQTDKDDFRGWLTVRRSSIEEVSSILNSNQPDLKSTMYAKFRDDITSIITLRAIKTSEIISELKTNSPELTAKLVTKYRDDLTSFFTVRQNIKDELVSTLSTTTGEIVSKLIVRTIDSYDLTASLTIRRSEKGELASYLATSAPELISKVRARVIENNELTATIFARRSDNADLSSEFAISQPELHGTLFAYKVGSSDLTSTVLIYQNDTSSIDTNLSASQPELHATLISTMIHEVKGQLNTNEPELKIKLIARAFDTYNLNAHLRPRVVQVSDLTSYFTVVNKARSGSYYYII